MLRVVVDASAIIGLCANEPRKVQQVIDALDRYFDTECTLHAPHLIVMEALYIFCQKEKQGLLTQDQHRQAIVKLQTTMTTVLPPSDGDASLITRAEVMRGGYGCSHSADGLYLALAEELAKQGATELLTFDEGQAKQAAASVPHITVNLLVP